MDVSAETDAAEARDNAGDRTMDRWRCDAISITLTRCATWGKRALPGWIEALISATINRYSKRAFGKTRRAWELEVESGWTGSSMPKRVSQARRSSQWIQALSSVCLGDKKVEPMAMRQTMLRPGGREMSEWWPLGMKLRAAGADARRMSSPITVRSTESATRLLRVESTHHFRMH